MFKILMTLSLQPGSFVKMENLIFVFQVISFLLILSPTVECQCENGKGTEGKTECVSSVFFGDSNYEPAVCLKRSTIKSLTNKITCRDLNTNSCWHQCSATSGMGVHGTNLCQCDPQKEIKPRDSLVPIKCYIPAGTDCSWYKECLETRIACESTNERYAITYAEKYCKLYDDRYARFSDKGKVWIDAVRKCLQESLAYVMYPQSDVTCQSVKETAFLSHINCYKNPELGISFCDLSLSDQFRVFWTIKGALLEEFTKTVSSGWSVFKTCFSSSYPKKTERIIQLEIEPPKTKLTEKNVEDISVRLAFVLGWPTDIMFSSSSSKLSNPNSIPVNIVISSKTYNNAYVNEAVNSVIERGLSNTLVALALEDGRTLQIQGIKGCNDPSCSSTSFAFRTCKFLAHLS